MICRMSFKSYHNGFGSNALGEPTQPLTRKSPAGPHKPFANYSYCVVSAYNCELDNVGEAEGPREFINLLGGAAVPSPTMAPAQPTPVLSG